MVTGAEIGKAVASPTKNFFVRMLTRDIELQDALLDLLDNCVDGIIRSGGSGSDTYEGYSATITLEPDYFSIEDNCGGIPIEIAKKYAFAMGRPPGADELEGPATVGMYGIGMKRAIFKLGSHAVVESCNDVGFSVEFSAEWMQTDSWEDLPIYELDSNSRAGYTKVEVIDLNSESSSAFAEPAWIDDFRKVIARHYSIIIDKGFSVIVGSRKEIEKGLAAISSAEFKLLSTDEVRGGGKIAPYVYAGQLEGVDVEIYAGLYRELLTESEAEAEESTRGSIDDAGWTIACNDRVVVWKDKSRLTGWGEADVPNYHGQFIAITGIVLLKANDPKLLPLTTTKRGIDGSSNLYSEIKDLMREATKSLTTFTNRWKKFPADLEEIYKGARYLGLEQLRAMPAEATTTSRRMPSIKKIEPSYPVPVREVTSVRVVFDALKEDVALVSEHYFGDERVKPGVAAGAAFSEVVARLRRGEA